MRNCCAVRSRCSTPSSGSTLPERARWAVAPKYDEDGTPKCTACLICVKECPDHILRLDVSQDRGRQQAHRHVRLRGRRVHDVRPVRGGLPVRRHRDEPRVRARDRGRGGPRRASCCDGRRRARVEARRGQEGGRRMPEYRSPAIPFLVLAVGDRRRRRRWSMLVAQRRARRVLGARGHDGRGRAVPAAVRRVPRARAGHGLRRRGLGARCCSPSCSRCAAARTRCARATCRGRPAGIALAVLVAAGDRHRVLRAADPPRCPRVTPGVAEFGRLLFTGWALPFEIASVVLLVALVGAVWWSGGDE